MQIAIDPPPREELSANLYALCDDGTLWHGLATGGEGGRQHWTQLERIPQD
jgi:hypothetical protein